MNGIKLLIGKVGLSGDLNMISMKEKELKNILQAIFWEVLSTELSILLNILSERLEFLVMSQTYKLEEYG